MKRLSIIAPRGGFSSDIARVCPALGAAGMVVGMAVVGMAAEGGSEVAGSLGLSEVPF
jgi:hypothetical protein